MLGTILMVALPTQVKIGRLIGYYLTLASPTGFVAILSLISSNIAGYTKKTTIAALYLIAYCVGNIIGEDYHSLTRSLLGTLAVQIHLLSARNLELSHCLKFPTSLLIPI